MRPSAINGLKANVKRVGSWGGFFDRQIERREEDNLGKGLFKESEKGGVKKREREG